MRKKAIILAAIYVTLLIPGVWVNMQRGIALQDGFWREKDGGYESVYGDWIRCEGDASRAHLEMQLGGKTMTAEMTLSEDGVRRIDFSDGWALESEGESMLSIEMDGAWMIGDTALILTDMDAAGLRFVGAAGSERQPFYDENGREAGETILMMSEAGETIDYREVWYEHPEYNTEPRREVVLTDGARISQEDMYDALFLNEKGEYLVDRDSLTMLRTGDGWVSRTAMMELITAAAGGRSGFRGSPAAIALYTLAYALGAAYLLWPEKLAFFGARWQFQNEPELSDAGLLSMQIGSVLVLVASVIVLFSPFLGGWL